MRRITFRVVSPGYGEEVRAKDCEDEGEARNYAECLIVAHCGKAVIDVSREGDPPGVVLFRVDKAPVMKIVRTSVR